MKLEYRLAIKCPRCGAPPPLRVSQREIDAKRMEHPSYRVQSFECQAPTPSGGKCGKRFWILAGAYHSAQREVA